MRLGTVVLWAVACACSPLPAAPNHWVATWGASPAPQLPAASEMRAARLTFQNQTIREIVHTSIGGDTVRVRLSNAFGKKTVVVGAAHLALRAEGPAVTAASDRTLTFGGRKSVSIPPDALVLSDPVKLDIPAAGDVAVSIFLPEETEGAGLHYAAQQTSYVGQGDLTGAPSIPGGQAITSWAFLTALEVLAPETIGTLVTFGDSITDGARSSLDANRRWPDVLAARLRARRGASKVAVLNAGIGGNRILHDAATNVRFGVNALARFDRDVLAQAGVRYVIVLEGINDLGHAGTSAPASETVSAEEVIVGMKQLIERAHEKGIKIFGATITPFEGTAFPGYFTPEKEQKRKAINAWIRTGKAFDGVIDFEKAVRDPAHPDRILPAYDGGDHLHPGDAGYKAMGEAVDLALFQ